MTEIPRVAKDSSFGISVPVGDDTAHITVAVDNILILLHREAEMLRTETESAGFLRNRHKALAGKCLLEGRRKLPVKEQRSFTGCIHIEVKVVAVKSACSIGRADRRIVIIIRNHIDITRNLNASLKFFLCITNKVYRDYLAMIGPVCIVTDRISHMFHFMVSKVDRQSVVCVLVRVKVNIADRQLALAVPAHHIGGQLIAVKIGNDTAVLSDARCAVARTVALALNAPFAKHFFLPVISEICTARYLHMEGVGAVDRLRLDDRVDRAFCRL